jgi:glucan phosphoethanolaminetransferase (alkaline phosphatase superfamily)
VAAEAAESRRALRAVSLLLTLVACKAATLVLAREAIPLSPWTPVAYFWQDALVVAAFVIVDAAIRSSVAAWILYAAVVLYAAINVPIAVVLSTPLTLTMMRAAGGALADSIRHYVTPPLLVGLTVPLVIAVVSPFMLGRRARRIGPAWGAVLIAAGALGPTATARVDTNGMHRNAVGTLVRSAWPRVGTTDATADWRTSPFASDGIDSLAHLNGIARKRNVVVVVLESTASRYLRPFGGADDPMPVLTALAREAVVFDRAYAVYPESVKGLFTTLCSQYTAFDTAPDMYADATCDSIAATLKSAGYRTALFHSGRFDYLGMRSIIDNRGFDVLEDAGAIGGNVQSSFGVDEASTVRRVLQWIDKGDSSSPFFALYLPIAGHHPYGSNVPGPFNAPTDFASYLNALHEADTAIASLIDGLKARGVYDDTLLVIFGDHGEAFGQHAGNFAHTLYIYEENIRVPYVIVIPGAVTTTVRPRRPASLLDTAPTIVDLLGLPAVPSHQGTSLLDPRRRMALFYTDYSLGWLGLVDACWKYLHEIDSGRSRLFDVCVDPDEKEDRSGVFPDRVTAYRERVQLWAAAQRAAVKR